MRWWLGMGRRVRFLCQHLVIHGVFLSIGNMFTSLFFSAVMTTADTRSQGIPDGGWGWVVVAGAFVQHVVTHGVFFSIGIMFTSLQEALNGSKVQIAWVVSIEIGSGFLSGPVTGYLISKYGTRIVSVVGSILGACGYILSMYANNVYVLYVTMGLISGIGFGMIVIPAIVVVNEYFDTHRGVAAGISMAGTGCGAFLFNPLLNWLMERYGWRGSLLVLAAIILNCIPAGLVYRPLKKRRKKHDDDLTVTCPQSMHSINGTFTSTHSINGDLKYMYTSDIQTTNSLNENEKLNGVKNDRNISIAMSLNSSLTEKLDSNGLTHDTHTNLMPTVNDSTKEIGDSKVKVLDQDITCNPDLKDHYTPSYSSHNGVIELVYDDPADEKASIDPLLTDTRNSEVDGSVDICYEIDSQKTELKREQKRKTGLLSQFYLFKNMMFNLTVLAQFMFNFGFYVPFVYLPDKSKQEGINETSTVLVLSTMGVASIVGRIAFGYIADRPGVNRLLLYTSGFLISGAVTSLCPLYNEIWMLYSYAIIFGMFTGMVLGLTPVVLIDMLGLETLPATFGISCLFRGFASLLGSPCAGFLVDLTGDYTASFIVAGLFMVCGAFLMVVAKYIKR